MSFLDLYQGDQQQAMRPALNEGHDLPASFGESFRAAWDYGRMFAASNAGENARMAALDDYVKDVRDKTGTDITGQMDWTLSAPGVGPVPNASAALLEQASAAVRKLKDKTPDLDLPEMDQDGLQRAAEAKARQSGIDLAAMSQREHSGLGMFAGGAAASATDPINVLALPIAPETGTVSVLSAALRWGAVAGMSQAAIEAAGADFRERVQPGYAESGAAGLNILQAFGGGAALGGMTRFLGNSWTRAKTGAWPTSVRDAGNLVESHAQVQDSNVYLGAEGEAAHWDAMNFSIDNILDERPVDVTDIITPQMEAQSRNLLARIEGGRAAALPAFDQRSVALLSEEAGLRSRDTELAGRLQELPPVSEAGTTAIDRLNRLQAVEAQIQQAEGAPAKRLLDRRDQVLVDTTPERLQAEAEPVIQRQQAEAERARIADRLAEIEQERSAARAQTQIGLQPAMVGQQSVARPLPIEDLRRMAAASAEIATNERAAAGVGVSPELPFEATAAEAHARASLDALADGVRQIASRTGYAMPGEEATKVASALKDMPVEQAQDAIRDLQVSPRQASDIVQRPPEFPAPTERPAVPDVQAFKASLDAPDHETAIGADIDRQRVAGDVQVPVDIDRDGNPVYRSLDGMADEVEAYRMAAQEIASCAAPAPVEEGA